MEPRCTRLQAMHEKVPKVAQELPEVQLPVGCPRPIRRLYIRAFLLTRPQLKFQEQAVVEVVEAMVTAWILFAQAQASGHALRLKFAVRCSELAAHDLKRRLAVVRVGAPQAMKGSMCRKEHETREPFARAVSLHPVVQS